MPKWENSMKTVKIALVAALAATAMSTVAQARDQIQIVGSSTVFPFTTAVAEKLGQGGNLRYPGG
jgi:phosphate transport system substrate-binding protein